jgi:methylated-DNA-[protein]-cysteine S-methyltransferase
MRSSGLAPTPLRHQSIETPIGPVHLVDDGAALVGIDFGAPEDRLLPLLRRRFGTVELIAAEDRLGCASRLRRYFAGELRAIEDMPVDGGGSTFQRTVWAALREIPAGTTTTYGTLAERLGVPRASRAVGLANGRNPISIIVPCHRIVGAGGALTGYGGGIERKRWLLAHEGAVLAERARRFPPEPGEAPREMAARAISSS